MSDDATGLDELLADMDQYLRVWGDGHINHPGHTHSQVLREMAEHADRLRAALAARPAGGEGDAVEVMARAAAMYEDYDGCFEEVDDYEALVAEFPGEYESGDERPNSAYEDCEWWRTRMQAAVAALAARAGDDAVPVDVVAEAVAVEREDLRAMAIELGRHSPRWKDPAAMSNLMNRVYVAITAQEGDNAARARENAADGSQAALRAADGHVGTDAGNDDGGIAG